MGKAKVFRYGANAPATGTPRVEEPVTDERIEKLLNALERLNKENETLRAAFDAADAGTAPAVQEPAERPFDILRNDDEYEGEGWTAHVADGHYIINVDLRANEHRSDKGNRAWSLRSNHGSHGFILNIWATVSGLSSRKARKPTGS